MAWVIENDGTAAAPATKAPTATPKAGSAPPAPLQPACRATGLRMAGTDGAQPGP